MGDGMLVGVRKTSAAKGDDTTLTRFVKVEGGRKMRHQRRQAKLPGFETPFIAEGRTKFPKTVKRVDEISHLLVSGHNNVKIGRDVRKGKFKGYWIYTLSLEERKTCPPSCLHWQSCYGNNMPFAKRIDHTDPDFLPTLEKEIRDLCAKKKGVLIRLHALGDFYSQEYVGFWWEMLERHTNLAIFGYTARKPEGENLQIGQSIVLLNDANQDRCMVRFSNGGTETMATVSIGGESSRPANAFICPEQTNKTKCCATCGACWSTTKNVAFLEH